eukprot:1259773-Pyramimonas_sp.AAC.1
MLRNRHRSIARAQGAQRAQKKRSKASPDRYAVRQVSHCIRRFLAPSKPSKKHWGGSLVLQCLSGLIESLDSQNH